MRSPFARLNRRAITWDKMYGSDVLPTPTFSGKSVNEEVALKHSVVWGSANLIVDAVAHLTPEAFALDAKERMDPRPVPRWIMSPHPSLTRAEVWSQLLLSVLLWGNGYGQFARRPSDQAIVGMIPLAPNTVQCEWDTRPGRSIYRQYRVNGKIVPPEDMFHLMGPSLPGAAVGMSVIAQAKEAIGLGLTLEEFGARYFAQGSMAKVVIKVPSTSAMDPARALDIVRTYERFHKGAGNWHRPAVLTGPAGTDITNISIPPEEAQFLESREFQAIDVARWFRVPPHRVGIISKQSSWGSGLAEENMAMVQHTFRPWIRRMEEHLTLYTPYGEDAGVRIRLQESELLRGTFKEQIDAWGTAVEKQIATPNEARKAIGLDPITGGDKLVKPPEPKPFGDKPNGDQAPDKKKPAAGDEQNSFRFNGAHDNLGRFTSKGVISAGSTYDELSPKGQAAVDATMANYGITNEALDAEIESKLTPATIEAGARWYPDAKAFNQQLADKNGISLEQATAITSACSPQTPWPRNKVLADKVSSNFRDHEGVPAQEAAKRMGGGLSLNMGAGIEMARGGSIDANLTGVKRRSFYDNMLQPGQTREVTLDTHMMKAFPAASTKELTPADSMKILGASKTSTNGGAGYVALSDSVRRVADKHGLPPDTVQAAYWVAVAGTSEGKYKG